MPPRRFKKETRLGRIVEKRWAKAIEKYEKTRADSNNTVESGSTNTGGTLTTMRFHELALMCHELVPTEKEEDERYFVGFPERTRNITSSKLRPCMMQFQHVPVNGRAKQFSEGCIRIGESIKGKWEDNSEKQQKQSTITTTTTTEHNNNHNNNNNRNRNNNHHQQQNRRHENVRVYAATQLEERFMLEIYQNATGETYIIMDRVLKSSRDVKELVTWRRIFPLPYGKILEVKARGQEKDLGHLHVSKADEKSLMTYALFQDSPKVFPMILLEVQFLGHVVNRDGIHVDPSKVEYVKNWKTPESTTKIRSFLGLAGYYQRFIENFSKIAKPLTPLTQKNKAYVWGDKQYEAFQILKEKLCNAPVLALPDGPDDFWSIMMHQNKVLGAC
ncbi:hypothetical protein Tco_0777918 [Tanacetum coccineum]